MTSAGFIVSADTDDALMIYDFEYDDGDLVVFPPDPGNQDWRHRQPFDNRISAFHLDFRDNIRVEDGKLVLKF